MRNQILSLLCLAITFVTAEAVVYAQESDSLLAGKKSYEAKCAKCHGKQGEGVADVYDENLYGDRPFAELVTIITETMPDEHPEECVGEEAKQVAEYMYETFYTAAARAKHKPARIELSRLTGSQYLNSIADIADRFIGFSQTEQNRGLKGIYFDSRNAKNDKKRIDRIDPVIKFNYGTESPGEKIGD